MIHCTIKQKNTIKSQSNSKQKEIQWSQPLNISKDLKFKQSKVLPFHKFFTFDRLASVPNRKVDPKKAFLPPQVWSIIIDSHRFSIRQLLQLSFVSRDWFFVFTDGTNFSNLPTNDLRKHLEEKVYCTIRPAPSRSSGLD